MPRIRGIRPTFHDPGRPPVADVDDEFAFHLEMRTHALIAEGWAPDAARREALRLFGDLEDARTYCTELTQQREKHAMRIDLLDGIRQDLGFALRSLRRTPVFTLAAVATLALGVGANVTMFGIVDRLLLRPPAHVTAPELMRRLYFTFRAPESAEVITHPHIGYPAYAALAEGMRPVGSVAAFATTELVLGEGTALRRGQVTIATSSFFPALGVRPELGRFFTAEEDTPPSGARVAVISHALWASEHGRDRAVLGRFITIGGQRFEIIGVAPPGFAGLETQRVDAWVPVSAMGEGLIGQFTRGRPWHQATNVSWLRAIARLRSDGLIAQGEQLATTAFRNATGPGRTAGADSTGPRASLEPLLLERGPDRTPTARIAVWLAGMSLLVLLIACANVANLLLARALGRRREIAVRMALGAGRSRLVAQLLTEGMVIAVLGGLAALIVAHSGGQLVRDILIPDVEWGGALFDARTLALAATVVLGTGVLIGLVPALQASDMNLAGALKTGEREGGGRRSVTRTGLVIVQAALSVVLLAGAGLFHRSLDNARSVNLGFTTTGVLTVRLDMGAGSSTAETMEVYERLHDRMRTIPGVEQASLAFTEPFATTIQYAITIPGRDSIVLPPSGAPRMNAVTPEYFATMGTRLVAGRGFTADDRQGMPLVGVVNETMARSLWPGASALGERACISEIDTKPCFMVVGVVEDARWNSLKDAPTMQMYFPLVQNPSPVPLRVLHLRTSGDPAPVIRAVRDVARQVAPRVLFADVDRLEDNLEPEMRPWRLGAVVFTVFGVLALLLAGLGLYSVIAYDVGQRTREMAVRMALGARGADVLRLIVTQGVRYAAAGIIVGLVIALSAGRWVGPLLFELAPGDPVVLGTVAVTLFAVALAASFIPAWRATRVAPGAALRAE